LETLIKIGEIVAPHGIKGEVKVVPLTDYLERFNSLRSVFLTKFEKNLEEKLSRVEIESFRLHKQFLIMKFKGIDDPDTAQSLRGNYLCILPQERFPLPPGTYYYDQIIGLTAINRNEEVLGVITDIFRTGSNDVYVIKTNELTKSGKPKELLFPALKSLVEKIDLENKKIYLNFPEELR